MDVNRYRLYCNTESNYVFAWGESNPTTCPNNPLHDIDLQSLTILDTAKLPTYTDTFTRPFIDARSPSGISPLRDAITGTVILQSNLDGSPIELQGLSQLSTTQLGTFPEGKASIMLRSASSNGLTRWGYYDNRNGYYFALNSNNNLDCIVLREGALNVLLTRSNHDATTHKMYDIIYSPQYVRFQVNGGVICERMLTTQQTPSYYAYPIRIASSNAAVLQVLQRRYCAGSETTESVARPFRNIAITRAVPMPAAAALVPLLTIRRIDQPFTTWVKLDSIEFYPTTHDIQLEIRANTTLTGAAFALATADSIVESDTAATAVTPGVTIWTGVAVAAGAKAVLDVKDIDLYDTISIVGRAVTTASGTVYVSLRWREGW